MLGLGSFVVLWGALSEDKGIARRSVALRFALEVELRHCITETVIQWLRLSPSCDSVLEAPRGSHSWAYPRPCMSFWRVSFAQPPVGAVLLVVVWLSCGLICILWGVGRFLSALCVSWCGILWYYYI